MDLCSFVPTLSQLLKIAPPLLAKGAPFFELQNYPGTIRRALIYCPDAFGLHALTRLPALETKLRAASTHQVELQSVVPPVTPVCFASLFTGAQPVEHGIRHYEKPVLLCDTLFDSLLRANKKVAIVAVENSSIDLLFRGRHLDYYPLPDDASVTGQALELLKLNLHDVLVVYHSEYDDTLHATEPFSEKALLALARHTETWELLVRKCQEAWQKEFLLAFTPDHGAHFDSKLGVGDHGADIPEDMLLRHYYYLS